MRITNSMMVSSYLTDLNASLNRVSDLQSQVNTSKRISTLSDDPVATAQSLIVRSNLSTLSIYQSNIDTAQSALTTAETSVDSLNDIIQSAYEIAVDANDGTLTQDDLDTFATQIANLRDEVLSIANTTQGTNYIFGGYNVTGTETTTSSNTPPFTVDEDTGLLMYNGLPMYPDAAYTYGVTTVAAAGTAAQEASETISTATTDEDILAGLEDSSAAATAAAEAATKALNAADSLGLSGSNYDALVDAIDAATAAATDATDAVSTSDTTNATTLAAASEDAITAITTALSNLQSEVTTAADANALLLEEEADKTVSVQIGTSQSVDITYAGTEILGTGEDNIYYILDTLYNDLTAGNTDSIASSVTALQSAQSDVLTTETEIGGTINRLDLLDERYTSSELNYTEMKSDVEDADLAEAITNLTMAMTVYEAALAAGSNIIQNSLVDYLN